MRRVAAMSTKYKEYMSETNPFFVRKTHTSFRDFPAVETLIDTSRPGTYRIFVSKSHTSLLGMYVVSVSRPHSYLSGTQPVLVNLLDESILETRPIAYDITELLPSLAPDWYHTVHFGWYLLCLQHHRTAKYSMEFEDVFHAK